MNTVEGAIVMSALTVVVGGLLAGFGTMATASATQSLARDVARAEAMGADGQALAHAKDPGACWGQLRHRQGDSPGSTVRCPC